MTILNNIIEVKINEKELKKVLTEMSLFDDLKEEIEAFNADEQRLDQQLNYVQDQIQDLQNKLTQNMLDQETANIADSIYLKMDTKRISEEMQVLESVLAEVKETKEELMYSYYKKYRAALGKASLNAAEYDFTPVIVEAIGTALSIGKEVSAEAAKQYGEIYPHVSYLMFDKKVLERYPRTISTYDANLYKPRFNWKEKTVLGTDQVKHAIENGQVPNEFKVKDAE